MQITPGTYCTHMHMCSLEGYIHTCDSMGGYICMYVHVTAWRATYVCMYVHGIAWMVTYICTCDSMEGCKILFVWKNACIYRWLRIGLVQIMLAPKSEAASNLWYIVCIIIMYRMMYICMGVCTYSTWLSYVRISGENTTYVHMTGWRAQNYCTLLLCTVCTYASQHFVHTNMQLN